MNDPNGEETIFAGALRLTPAERAAYLHQRCGHDAALRQRVEVLLNASGQAQHFLEQPASATLRSTRIVSVPLTEKVGDKIGRYKLLQQIGEGGCGVVYMAEQEEPVRRRVAVKVIKLGMDTKSVIARFEAERQALALMDHPNIAKVLDAGATDTGRPYFVMELVRGLKITDYCDEKKLPTKQRLDLFIQVCQAIQHAHQKGIIHRDIKPSNILVTINDGVPVPKVIDFGIAKATGGVQLTDKTLFTAFEQFIGTPAYMSPEQAVMTSLDLDTRSDIYALGVLLYELLTGKTPFDGKELMAIGLDEMRRTIREKEPERPSTRLSTMPENELGTTAQRRGLDAPQLVSELRGDLDWIVMKALEKDRDRRYETANGLAMEIQRHLNNEPVLACPPSNLYRFQKMVRRNKGVVAAVTAVAAALVMGLGLATWMFLQERVALKRAVSAERAQTLLRQKAEAEERNAVAEAAKSKQVAQFLQDMLKGVAPSVARGRDTALLREILDQTTARLGKDLTNQPSVEAELRRTIGRVYFDLGDLKKAEDMQREALRLRKAISGTNDVFVAALLVDLARSINEQGQDRPGAELLSREALGINQKLFGPDHRNVVVSLHLLGWVLLQQNKDSEAEGVYRRSLTMAKKLPSAEDQDFFTAASLSMLALTLSHVPATLAEAESLQREALAMHRKQFGNEDLNLATSLGNLGWILRKAGKIAEADAADREDLAIERKLLEPGHPRLAKSILGLGDILRREGNLDESEKVYREVLSMSKKLGPDHSSVKNALAGVAQIVQERGGFSEEWLLDLQKQVPDVGTVNFLGVRVTIFGSLGQWEKAANCLRQSIELNPDSDEGWHSLAPTLIQSGQIDLYRTYCRKSLEQFKTTTNLLTAERIAKDCLLLPSSEVDLDIVSRLADKAAAATGHPSYPWFALVKALSDYRRGNFKTSAEWAQKALTSSSRQGSVAYQVVEAYAVLAMACRGMNQPDQARAALEQAASLTQQTEAKPDKGSFGEHWRDWIMMDVLLREARAVVNGDPKINSDASE